MAGRTPSIMLLLIATIAATFLVAWTAGLLDLGGDENDDVILSHNWHAVGTEGEPELYEVNLSFQVGNKVGRIRVHYRVELPSAISIGLPGTSEEPSPEVRIELRNGMGQVVWTDALYSSQSYTEDIDTNAAGEWSLHLWARGYGYEGETGIGTPVEFHDSVKVSISVP